jgi:hypothetical protein
MVAWNTEKPPPGSALPVKGGMLAKLGLVGAPGNRTTIHSESAWIRAQEG